MRVVPRLCINRMRGAPPATTRSTRHPPLHPTPSAARMASGEQEIMVHVDTAIGDWGKETNVASVRSCGDNATREGLAKRAVTVRNAIQTTTGADGALTPETEALVKQLGDDYLTYQPSVDRAHVVQVVRHLLK